MRPAWGLVPGKGKKIMNELITFCLANRAQLLWSLAILFLAAGSLLWAEYVGGRPLE